MLQIPSPQVCPGCGFVRFLCFFLPYRSFFTLLFFYLFILPCRYPAHKYVLAVGSSVFYAMFYGGLPCEEMVKVPDVEPQAFLTLLRCVFYAPRVSFLCRFLCFSGKFSVSFSMLLK